MQDPTIEEMRDALSRDMPFADEWTTEPAIYWFANDQHGGRASSLYAALCASPYKPSMLERECPEDAIEAYNTLIECFGD